MSETEMTDEVENMEDEVSVNTDSTDEGETTSDEEEITYEQARAWKQELEKARKKIAHMSKDKKAVEKPETSKEETKALDDDTLDELLDRRDFYKKNTDAKALKDDIETLYKSSKGKFSREELYAKLSGDDDIEENRKVYAKSSVTGKQSSTDSFVAVDIDKYDSMSPSQQKAYNNASKEKYGGVKFKE